MIAIRCKWSMILAEDSFHYTSGGSINTFLSVYV